MARALRRMSHEIVESNDDVRDLVLAGVVTRGVVLAERLAVNLDGITGVVAPVGVLNVDAYRDDGPRDRTAHRPPTQLPGPITGKTVVLVDDVLYTGRTSRAALDLLADLGRPRRVRLAVLVDRGHRELPIRADYVGKNLPTSHDERVAVRLAETDGVDTVVLEWAMITPGARS